MGGPVRKGFVIDFNSNSSSSFSNSFQKILNNPGIMALSASGLGGQSLTDRVNAARYAISGQAVVRVVCKASTEEISGPKKKHLDYLLQCTHEPNVSIPSLANTLIERTTNSSWVVVFKSLITVHHLMCYGNERFTQYLATSNCTFNLTSFMDKSSSTSIEMSTFIRRYSKYLNSKALAYRSVGADFAKMKRTLSSSPASSNPAIDTSLRCISGDRILKTLPVLQSLVDSLLEFDASPRDLSNGVITAAFMLLYRDLIRLFACFNDGIINLLEKFFSFKGKKECREALELYKKFLIRMDRVAEFLKTAETIGINRGEIPDLTRAPSSLLEALEAHCLQLEGKDSSSVASSKIKPVTSELSKEEAYKKALEEEAEFLAKIERQKKQQQSSSITNNSSLFMSSSSSSNKVPSLGSSSSVSSKASPSVNLLGAAFAPGNNGSGSGTTAGASDPDFNPFLLGDPIEESTGSTGAKNKKVAEEILALFESNTASMNAGFTASNPYFMQPFNTHPQQQQQQQQQVNMASMNPFVSSPGGASGVASLATSSPSLGHFRAPVMHQNAFIAGNSMMTSQSIMGQSAPPPFNCNPINSAFASSSLSNLNNSSTSSSSSFEANFASAFPSTTGSSGLNNNNNNNNSSSSGNSLFSSQPASAVNPHDFSLI